MRIGDTSRTYGPGAAGGARSTAGGGRFTLDAGAETRDAPAARATALVSGLDAMIALQAVDDPLQRRRRAVRRGRRLLDMLDALKVSMLDGRLAAADVSRLSALVAEGGDLPDDPGLADVLSAIDLRASVEMAKLQVAREKAMRGENPSASGNSTGR